MSDLKLNKHSLEILEARIAPANATAVTPTAPASPLLPTDAASYIHASLGAAVEVHAGQVLTTGGYNDGTYLLYVEKGNALVFFTDLNNNKKVDFDELTGIAAGDGLRITLFTDVHGDIVTNLVEQKTSFVGGSRTVLSLSDSNHNPLDDDPTLRGDGRVLLNNTIEKVEIRSLRPSDLPDQDRSGVVDATDVALRQGPTTHSIFGNIYAGKGFGAADGGLIIDTSAPVNFGFQEGTFQSQIGSIRTGTAVSGEYFSFGAGRGDNINGVIVDFTPPRGQAGGDIIHVAAVDPLTMNFNLDGLFAGDGGTGARGGNIVDVTLHGEDTGGYRIVAGSGGRGLSGGDGGSIINFSDIGSSTADVLIQTGSGGVGASGAGGNAGNLSFNTFNILGDVTLKLGDGGNGFTAGGNGASLAKGVFTQPVETAVIAGNAYGTTHAASTENGYTAVIGTHQAVDFNGDGFGDFVYTTKGTSDLVVVLGGTGSGYLSGTHIKLNGARNVEAITIGDFNNDGHPDIAVASSDAGSQEGIVVFLSKWEDVNNDGVLTSKEDLNNNGKDDFVGFFNARYSVLPQLSSFDSDSTPGPVAWNGPTQVNSLSTGDFDGDGHLEIAAVVTYYTRKFTDSNGQTLSLAEPEQVVVFLSPEIEFDNVLQKDVVTGQFYADFGTKRVELPGQTIPANPILPFFETKGKAAGSVVIEATALNANAQGASTHDVLLVGVQGENEVLTVDYFARNGVPGGPALPVNTGKFSLGSVDTDRGDKVNAQPFKMLDFTTVDYNGDGLADIGSISTSPTDFFVGVKGDGTGNGTQTSGNGGNNSGNYFGGQGYDLTGSLLAIKSSVGQNQFSILLSNKEDHRAFVPVRYVEGPQAAVVSAAPVEILGPGTGEPMFFDMYYKNANDISTPTYAFASPIVSNALFSIDYPSDLSYLELLSRGIHLSAGNGGNSLVGNGGAGGNLGSGGSLQNVVDPTLSLTTKDFVGTLNFQVEGVVDLVAGKGGNGFANGGKGGSISGVSVRLPFGKSIDDIFSIGVSLTAGDGGRGVSGTGGQGGDIQQSSIFYGLSFTAGNGGVGNVGGRGGSVTGNGTAVYDTFTDSVFVNAGFGGIGTKAGGAGGSIVNFTPEMALPDDVIQTLGLSFVAGRGGDAVSGPGGAGGSIVNSSPKPNGGITGPLHLEAGFGGNGRTGGNGGSVEKFTFTSVAGSIRPTLLEVLAGDGGDGNVGPGGRGGGISNISVAVDGTDGLNKIIAGNGGLSSGGVGGAGGSISNISTKVAEASIAFAAGAGGTGLYAGGAGGSVNNVLFSSSFSTLSKGLVIAGAGGHAAAFVANPNDTTPNQADNAFGGRVGRGGVGGSINTFKQTGNDGAHFDFIAGNGGDTLNYGLYSDKVSYVGNGGSISNLILVGHVGQSDPHAQIKSYNDFASGETVAEFVTEQLRNGTQPLSDNLGNVGIVVGAAGRTKAVHDINEAPGVYESQPAKFATNGSLTTVVARSLMAAVAGSVDQIAAIQVAKNLQIVAPIGADKDTVGVTEFLNQSGQVVSKPEIGGALIDGRVIAHSIVDALNRQVAPTGTVKL